MMLDRMEGNAELKSSVQLMLAARRLTHSVLLVGEEGLGAGFAARCIAADYLYPAGGAPAEALLRGECCRAVGKPGDRDSGHVETGIVREAISVAGMGAGGKYLVSQVKAMRSEIFNTSLSAEGRAVLLYHVEKMNEESANALLKVMEEPPEGVLFLLTADSLAGRNFPRGARTFLVLFWCQKRTPLGSFHFHGRIYLLFFRFHCSRRTHARRER